MLNMEEKGGGEGRGNTRKFLRHLFDIFKTHFKIPSDRDRKIYSSR